MWDQLGSAGFFAAFLGNPFGIRGAVASGADAAWQGLINGSLRFNEFIGRLVGPRLAWVIFTMVALLVALGIGSEKAHQYVVNPELRGLSVHSYSIGFLIVGSIALCVYALIQKFGAARNVSVVKSGILMFAVPMVLAIIEFIDAGLTKSGWHLAISAGYFVVADASLALTGGAVGWFVKKAIQIGEAGLRAVVEPVLAVALPGYTLENITSRTRELLDVFKEDWWSQAFAGLAKYLAIVVIPFFGICTWWVDARFYAWLAGIYFTLMAIAWVASQEGLGKEVLLSRQSFYRWLMTLFVPVRILLELIGNPEKWMRNHLVGNHGYILPILVLIVGAVALYKLLHGLEKAGMVKKFFVVLASLVTLWAVIALYVRANNLPGWSPIELDATQEAKAKASVEEKNADATQVGTPTVKEAEKDKDFVPAPPPPPWGANKQASTTQPASKPATAPHTQRVAGTPMTKDQAKDRLNDRIKRRGLQK